MNDESCEIIREMLVDYDDGQLSAEQTVRVTQHLSECTSCRGEFDRLQESLKLAKEIWEDTAANIADVEIPLPGKIRSFGLKRLATAAGVVLAASTLIWIWLARSNQNEGPAGIDKITSAEQAARFIEREAASAKLAATAQILTDVPGGQEVAVNTLRYLARTYPETEMGRQAANKISSN